MSIDTAERALRTQRPCDHAALVAEYHDRRIAGYGIHLDTWLTDPAAIRGLLEGEEYRPLLLVQRIAARQWERSAERLERVASRPPAPGVVRRVADGWQIERVRRYVTLALRKTATRVLRRNAISQECTE